MLNSLIHPNLLTAVRAFYPSTCTVQSATASADTFGEALPTWANVTGLVDLPCSIAPLTIESPANREERRDDMTVQHVTHRVALRGHYTAITPAMRLVADGVNYDILAVEQDSQGITTRLKVEKVSA